MKVFKPIYNYELTLDLLNRFTNETFKYNHEDEFFESENFELAETDAGLYSLDQLVRDWDTGAYNNFTKAENESLAGVIDTINELNGDLKT
jgi:hypothetical protein